MINKEFNPNITHPFYFARKALLDSITELSSEIHGRVLDVGCGQKPYMSLFSCTEYIGMDVEQSGHSHQNEEIDVFYDGKTFPFPDNSFDSIITSQVFEHVFTPDLFVKEIYRVLKPGGTLLLTVPFVWDEHEQPYDFARYSSFGLSHILKENNFTIQSHIKTLPDIRVIFQIFNTYIYKMMFRKRLSRIIAKLIFIIPNNISGIILNVVLPKNIDLYLDNVVLAKKVK
jgi:SAM-dependent methyltransferase